jgi:hypothetical protein
MAAGALCPSLPSELIGFPAEGIGLVVVVADVVGTVAGAVGVVIAPSDDAPEDEPCGVN